ncbi:MAG: hypothetical protein QW076_01040 [Candidatus Anstonellales archaeon]
MSKFKVNGIIEPEGICFKQGFVLNFYTDNQIIIKINPEINNKNKLLIEWEMNLDNSQGREEAKFIGKQILSMISNLLSYFGDIVIKNYGVINIYDLTNQQGYGTSTIALTACFEKEISEKEIKDLQKKLEKDYSEDFIEITSMWQQARSAKSIVEEYLYLYRILEKIFTKQSEIDDWIIKQKDFKVEYRTDSHKGEQTIFTWLRNNIHPKQLLFPIEEIESYLPQLIRLTKLAIQEKFAKEL